MMWELRREMALRPKCAKAQRKCVESDAAIQERAANMPARSAAEQRWEINAFGDKSPWNLRDIIEHTLRREVKRDEYPDISWDDVAEYLKTRTGVKKNPAILEQVRTAFEESVSRMQ